MLLTGAERAKIKYLRIQIWKQPPPAMADSSARDLIARFNRPAPLDPTPSPRSAAASAEDAGLAPGLVPDPLPIRLIPCFLIRCQENQ